MNASQTILRLLFFTVFLFVTWKVEINLFVIGYKTLIVYSLFPFFNRDILIPLHGSFTLAEAKSETDIDS